MPPDVFDDGSKTTATASSVQVILDFLLAFLMKTCIFVIFVKISDLVNKGLRYLNVAKPNIGLQAYCRSSTRYWSHMHFDVDLV